MPVLFPGVRDSIHIRLLAAGEIGLSNWWAESDLLRYFWRLYVDDGDGAWLSFDGKRFELPANRIVLVPPGLAFECKIDRPVRQLYALFEFLGWPAESVRELFPVPTVLEPEMQRDRLARELRQEIARSSSLEPIVASRLKALIHLSISELMSSIPDELAGRLQQVAEGQQDLLAVLRYIDKHLGEALDNARLAEIALASESRFIRRFRHATGQTPGRYVQDRRLRHASELLVSTDLSIDEIAETCGFANRFYFTRVFSQRMGRPPARYRNENPGRRTGSGNPGTGSEVASGAS